MRYDAYIVDEYVISVSSAMSDESGNITEDEYNRIVSEIENKPAADEGYDYRLKTDFTWELVEVPAVEDEQIRGYTESELLAMSNAELEQILYKYGRTANMNKSNMIDLILHLQADGNLPQ